MSRSRPFCFISVISKTGTLCVPLLQVHRFSALTTVIKINSSNHPCRAEIIFTPSRCVNYKARPPNHWYVWFLLLAFLLALLCAAVLFCLQCWLRRRRIDSSRRTRAVFAVGDLDSVYGAEAAVSPTVGIHLQIQTSELHPVPGFSTLGPPPPYEEILKSS